MASLPLSTCQLPGCVSRLWDTPSSSSAPVLPSSRGLRCSRRAPPWSLSLEPHQLSPRHLGRPSQLPISCALKDWRSSSPGGSDSGGALDPFARRRLENAWSVQQQPVPVACETCCAQGMKECEWCSGSGYFVLGDKMLCEVPSRNTQCLICHGHGTVRCPECLGTGFRARWLETLLHKKE